MGCGKRYRRYFFNKTKLSQLNDPSVIPYFIGMLLLGTLTADSVRLSLTIYMILVGFGMGFSFTLLPMSSQHNLDARQHGTAISTNSFVRTFGMTLGVSIFGTIQSKMFTGDVSQIFQPNVRAKVPTEILDKIIDAMSSSVSNIFLLSLIPVGLAVIAVFMMDNSKVSDLTKEENTFGR